MPRWSLGSLSEGLGCEKPTILSDRRRLLPQLPEAQPRESGTPNLAVELQTAAAMTGGDSHWRDVAVAARSVRDSAAGREGGPRGGRSRRGGAPGSFQPLAGARRERSRMPKLVALAVSVLAMILIFTAFGSMITWSFTRVSGTSLVDSARFQSHSRNSPIGWKATA